MTNEEKTLGTEGMEEAGGVKQATLKFDCSRHLRINFDFLLTDSDVFFYVDNFIHSDEFETLVNSFVSEFEICFPVENLDITICY